MPDQKRIVIFDVESTGSNTERDQIIEICIQSGLGMPLKAKRGVASRASRSHPALNAYGISDEDLKDCQPFSCYATEIRTQLETAEVLGGYNINFDISMLQAELARCNSPLLNTEAILLVDPYCLWRHFEPRDLNSAHKRFVGRPFDGAHAAQEDVRATGNVLEGMIGAFNLTESSWEKIAELCDVNAARRTWVGPSYHFRWDQESVVFGFGKHRARPVLDVKNEDNGGYLAWLAAKDFPEHVKLIAQRASKHSEEEFLQWVEQTFKREGTKR